MRAEETNYVTNLPPNNNCSYNSEYAVETTAHSLTRAKSITSLTYAVSSEVHYHEYHFFLAAVT